VTPIFVVRYRNRKGAWVWPGWESIDKEIAIDFMERKREEKGGEWGVVKVTYKKGKEVLTPISY